MTSNGKKRIYSRTGYETRCVYSKVEFGEKRFYCRIDGQNIRIYQNSRDSTIFSFHKENYKTE